MKYKIIQSNDAVNVIDVDGEIIQLSASIDIEGYLARKSMPYTVESNVPKSKRFQKVTEE